MGPQVRSEQTNSGLWRNREETLASPFRRGHERAIRTGTKTKHTDLGRQILQSLITSCACRLWLCRVLTAKPWSRTGFFPPVQHPPSLFASFCRLCVLSESPIVAARVSTLRNRFAVIGIVQRSANP